MGSHQLLVVTAEQKQVEKRIRDLNRWVARERDPQIARILRHEIDRLHLEWNHLQIGSKSRPWNQNLKHSSLESLPAPQIRRIHISDVNLRAKHVRATTDVSTVS